MMMNTGKLPHSLLHKLLSRNRILDDRVIVGPVVGEDAAVIDFGESCLVAKTDPITFATDRIGWYAVHVNANDIATMGAVPKWFLASILLPPGYSESAAGDIFDQLLEACREMDISLVGGHTEITQDLNRPIIIGCMLGEAAKDRLVRASGAAAGDGLLLAGWIAVEGTALLAREASHLLAERGVPALLIERAQGLLYDPGISVVKAAQAACDAARIHAMHDPTEGGLATGVMEMAQGAGLGVRIEAGSIPLLPECEAVCKALHLDPMGLLASGALLLAVAPEDIEAVQQALREAGLPLALIGQFCEPEDGLIWQTARGAKPLPIFARDEIARFFDSGVASLP
ncbi:MAG: hydrogenase expression/formation protein [Armatimonadetes bacterium]|nr:hydrogenase expression/formation protein [Armatimonadota bacterium]